MDLEIIKEGQEPFRLHDFDIIVEDIIIGSIPINVEYENVEGRSGRVRQGATYGVRKISVPFHILSYDNEDFPLLRDKLADLIIDLKGYYVREMRIPEMRFIEWHEKDQKNYYEALRETYSDGKRYHVTLSNEYELDQMFRIGRGTLEFETTELPFAESVFTSVDIEDNGLNYDADLYAYGMGLSYEDEKTIYSGVITPSNSLRIYNPGNKEIEPFEMPMKITIKSVQGGANGFKLRNITNDTSITFKGAVATSDVIVYDGAIITKNNLQATNQADLDYIELAKGWNEIKLERGQSVHFAVDTRFYYL